MKRRTLLKSAGALSATLLAPFYVFSKPSKEVEDAPQELKQGYITGILAILDQTPDLRGEYFSKECEVEFPKKCVPIAIEYSKKLNANLGFAEVWREGNLIKYKLDSNLIPLHIQKTLVPCLGGRLKVTEFDGKHKVLKEFSITDIGLTAKPLDKRLKTIWETRKII